mmetsp:Transcript_21053/g.50848  ORF Transcript_21053/g.50848 Transcript_21053/m.50848 type:complete len:260 (-) Transcript_21053:932-1711(-)
MLPLHCQQHPSHPTINQEFADCPLNQSDLGPKVVHGCYRPVLPFVLLEKLNNMGTMTPLPFDVNIEVSPPCNAGHFLKGNVSVLVNHSSQPALDDEGGYNERPNDLGALSPEQNRLTELLKHSRGRKSRQPQSLQFLLFLLPHLLHSKHLSPLCSFFFFSYPHLSHLLLPLLLAQLNHPESLLSHHYLISPRASLLPFHPRPLHLCRVLFHMVHGSIAPASHPLCRYHLLDKLPQPLLHFRVCSRSLQLLLCQRVVRPM